MAERQEKSFQTTLKGYRKGGRGKRRGGLGTPPRAGEDLFISFQREGGKKKSQKKGNKIHLLYSYGKLSVLPRRRGAQRGENAFERPFPSCRARPRAQGSAWERGGRHGHAGRVGSAGGRGEGGRCRPLHWLGVRGSGGPGPGKGERVIETFKKKKKFNPCKPLKPPENATKSGQLGSKSKKLGRILTKLQRLNLLAKRSESPGLAGDLGVLFP